MSALSRAHLSVIGRKTVYRHSSFFTGGSRKIELELELELPASRGKFRSNGGKRGGSGESPCKVRLPHLPRLASRKRKLASAVSVATSHSIAKKIYNIALYYAWSTFIASFRVSPRGMFRLVLCKLRLNLPQVHLHTTQLSVRLPPSGQAYQSHMNRKA